MRMTMTHTPLARRLLAAGLLGACAGSALAAEGFKVRFPLSGTLGGEIAATADISGVYGSVVVTQINIDKVTDEAGNPRSQTLAGTFATPAPIAGVTRTATYSATVNSTLKQTQTNANLILGYISEGTYGGGRFTVVFNLPYTLRLDRQLTLSGTTPTLSTLAPALLSPPLPAGTAAAAQAAAQTGFNTAYQAQLAAQSTAASGVVDGLGDAELTAGWIYRQDNLRMSAGVTVALPTGEYDSTKQVNVGFGNFVTIRPAVGVAMTPTPDLTLGMRASLGFNDRNRDNGVRSGNFGALDLAAAWRTPVGVVGPHVMVVRQFTDDQGGTLGANRFRATGAGAFFTSLIPSLNVAVNLSYMKMMTARNALSGDFIQIRASKAF